MTFQLPLAGAATDELAGSAHRWWCEAATKSGLCLADFDPTAPLSHRLAWAQSHGLQIGAVLSRYSSKLQHSTDSQVQECVEFAGRNKIYVPPEYLCVDEAVSGRKLRRDGLDRVKGILRARLATVLLVFKVSRLFRVAYKGYAFFQEEVVEEGLRAISVSQGIDTAEEQTWKPLACLHGLMDEMLLHTIADHVRSGIKSLFLQGYAVGALTVGYRPAEVPGAPPTNRGRPRTMPQIDPDAAPLIRQHFEWIRDGMPLQEGLRRWVSAGGPHDPRSTSGHMTYEAYRRMLANPRYTGRSEFGRKRNAWSSKRDYTRQVVQPDKDVALHQCEELRIIDDELFHAVQQRLVELKIGPRGHKKRTNLQLWDLVTDCFWCPCCQARYYQAGARATAMQCKKGPLCPCKVMVRRKEAVHAVCQKLSELIQQDAELMEETICRAQHLDAQQDDEVGNQIETLERRQALLSNKINDLTDLAGQGSDDDRRALKAKIVGAQTERAAAQWELARLHQARDRQRTLITPQRVQEILSDVTTLLEDGAAGNLGGDVIYRAAEVFRQLTGGRIDVQIESRPARKRPNVRGTFVPHLLRVVQAEVKTTGSPVDVPSEVWVWLRKPPRLDALAERVHELMDVGGMSYREAAEALKREGHRVNSGNVWQIYRRYYAMHDLPLPERTWNNGRPRQAPARQAS